VIGSSQTRADAQGKIEGTLRYTADIAYDGMLHGAIVRSPAARGHIRAIRRGEGIDWSRIVFATAEQIPGNRFVHMIADDMPFLADGEVRYKGEPVALVAASTVAEAEAARRAVIVEVESEPPILTLSELVERHCRRDKELLELARWRIAKGDVDRALAAAEVVLEGCYTTPHQEQAYLETNAMIAIPEGDGRMRVEGSLQCPYYVAPAVAGMLGTDLQHLHVRALPMGGGFGGKEDFPSQLGGHVALLAHLSGKPVRIVLSRVEDVAFTTKRHPSWIRVRAGARRDGTLCGVEIEIVFDGGAYITMSPVVLSRGAIHASGPYLWPAARIDAVAYRSNTPPNGAFRGFGVPQTIYAIESHIDQLARACGVEPHTFRLRNRLKLGDTTATSQQLRESVGSLEVLDEALRVSDFEARRRSCGQARRSDGERVARGVGMSFYWHGGGFTGAGEARISGRAAVDLRDDGRAHVRVAATEMGQGAHTVLAQIAAEELGLPPELAVCDAADTALVPNSGPTVASRTTMVVGAIVAAAARAARAQLFAALADRAGGAALSIRDGVICAGDRPLGRFAELLPQLLAVAGHDRWTFEEQYQLPPHIRWDEKTHTGDAYAAFAWACTVAEVEVDLDTYEVRVPRITSAIDLGRAVNPTLALGQIEGGILQGLGYALCEEVGVKPDGGLLRDRFQTYIVPTTLDAPRMVTRIVEVPYAGGPGGAKGLGELPVDGVAPAVANALEHALDVRVRDLPLTPERIFAALRERAAQEGSR
jgi:CO/xanthine dehydrogenase Mo-binding subunit